MAPIRTCSALHRVQAPLLWGSVEVVRACREQGVVWDPSGARPHLGAFHVAFLKMLGVFAS